MWVYKGECDNWMGGKERERGRKREEEREKKREREGGESIWNIKMYWCVLKETKIKHFWIWSFVDNYFIKQNKKLKYIEMLSISDFNNKTKLEWRVFSM